MEKDKKTLSRLEGLLTRAEAEEKSPSKSFDMPSVYKLRELIACQTEAMKAHTAADENWRDTVMELFDSRLQEKDKVIDLVKQYAKSNELDKTRWFRTTIICILIMAALVGIRLGELVGLVP